MTLEEARDELIAQAKLDVDLYKGVELDAEGNAIEEAVGATDLISRACNIWARETFSNYVDSNALTLVASTDTYDCRSSSVVYKVLKPRIVVINDSPLYRRDGLEQGLWSLSELERHRENYRLIDDGVPSIAVWLPGFKLLLSAPPAEAYTGKNFISGWTVPDDLVEGSDDAEELPVPEDDHFAVVRLAVVLGTMPVASEGAAFQRLSMHDSYWRDHAERRKRENVSAFLGRRPRGSRADWL